MSDDDDELVEDVARAFCEASGLYRWTDTGEFLRCWYRQGAHAAVAVLVSPNADAARHGKAVEPEPQAQEVRPAGDRG